MFTNNQIDNNGSCSANTMRLGDKLIYLALGCGIGAAIALLFAPKSGRELRRDIADVANRSYDETLAVADRAKEQVVEYYEAAKKKGDKVLDAVAEGASALKKEIVDDAAKIGDIMHGAAGRTSGSRRRNQVF